MCVTFINLMIIQNNTLTLLRKFFSHILGSLIYKIIIYINSIYKNIMVDIVVIAQE